jgi:hypothetical protein
MMNESRILGAVVVAAIIFDNLGILMWMCNVVILRKENLLYNGNSRDFGTKGYYEV